MTDPVTLTGQDGTPYLAVDIQPDSPEGIFTLDSSLLNGPDVLARSELDPNLWQNVVCDVLRVSYRRGAARLDGLLTQTEAGTCTVVLSDSARQFDPMATADTIHKGTPLRLRAWSYDTSGELWDAVLFTGEVDQMQATYHPEDPPTVVITGLDLVGTLAAWEAEGRDAPIGAGQDLAERTDLVLTEIGRGDIAAESDSTFAASLIPVTLARPWEDLTAAVTAELGRLWVTRDGEVLIKARGSELSGQVRGTLSDLHGETEIGAHCCMDDATVAYGWETAANRVLAQRQTVEPEDPDDAALVRRDYVASQARYGVGVIRGNGLHLETDGQVGLWAQTVIAAHGRPRLRVDQVSPAPSPADLDSALEAWPAVCATDLGDRWVFRMHPQAGPSMNRAIGVLGIEMEATPESWRVTWTTGPAPTPDSYNPYGWFLLDESELNGNALLAPYPLR